MTIPLFVALVISWAFAAFVGVIVGCGWTMAYLQKISNDGTGVFRIVVEMGDDHK